jgi:hypothetical protein
MQTLIEYLLKIYKKVGIYPLIIVMMLFSQIFMFYFLIQFMEHFELANNVSNISEFVRRA